MSVVDIIGKEIEVYKVKVFLFTAISGGSWVYAFKFEDIIVDKFYGCEFWCFFKCPETW